MSLVSVLVMTCLFTFSCARTEPLVPHTQGSPEVLPSAAYEGSAGSADQAIKIRRLIHAVRALRADSTSGWQARQDDRTGMASELSGGTIRAKTATSALEFVQIFLKRYGGAFGLRDPQEQLEFPRELLIDGTGAATFRSLQLHQGVPVDGGELLVPVEDARSRPAVSLARGRIFEGIEVSITPVIDQTAAAAAVRSALGVEPTGLHLVVHTAPTRFTLAWMGEVANAHLLGSVRTGLSQVFIDASTSTLLELRPVIVEGSASPARHTLGQTGEPSTDNEVELPPTGAPVQVSGEVHGGKKVAVAAEQLGDGSVALIDSTMPDASRETKKGVLTIHEGATFSITSSKPEPSLEDLPGPLLRIDPNSPDKDALTAAWAAREVMDYFRTEYGRFSFDGEGAPLPSTVHVPQSAPGQCDTNGAFIFSPGHEQMMYGVPCTGDEGNLLLNTFVDLDTVAHEITHGVTHTHATALGQTINTRAVDEAISDYFAMVILNRVEGVTEGAITTRGSVRCSGVTPNEDWCIRQKDGRHGVRSVQTGATMDDYLFTLEEPFGLASALNRGAGHANSMVMSNALWGARARLAAVDRSDINSSTRARRFDQAVYRAVTRYFTSHTDLIAAAEAVQRAAKEIDGMTAEDLGLIRRQFVVSKLCRKCFAPKRGIESVSVSGQVKVRPQLVRDGVLFMEYPGSISGQLIYAQRGSTKPRALTQSGTWVIHSVATKDRSAMVHLEPEEDRAVLSLTEMPQGRPEVISDATTDAVAPAISPVGLAWVDLADGSSVLRHRRHTDGVVHQIELPATPIHLATDAGRVAMEFPDGSLSVWDAPSGVVTDGLPSAGALKKDALAAIGVFLPPGGLALAGDILAVLSFAGSTDKWELVAVDLGSKKAKRISSAASPFGLALNGDLIVWAENVGVVKGRLAEAAGYNLADTDLKAYSFRSEKTYRLLRQRGQQGFPSFDGRRLVWQDASAGSNDIFSLNLKNPSKL